MFLSILVLAFSGVALHAGPLTPPPGPVASTGKTLTEVEPRIAVNATNTPGDADSVFRITQPGSYYLTGNITGVAGKRGVEITVSGVTLDLNGFDLVGVAGMGAFDGVSVIFVGLSNITVKNGSVRNWGDDGVDLGSAQASNCRVEGVAASGNATFGIHLWRGSAATKCAFFGNGLAGISTNAGCTISQCTAFQNTGVGINASAGCALRNCTVYDNGSTGIITSTGSTVSECTVYDNAGSGISVTTGCLVADCTVRLNGVDGIVCSASAVIRGNACSNNGNGGDGAGIHATGGDNRIEGNTCTGADRGIDVDLAGNIIIRNTCSGNTNNWDVVAGNIILVVNATAAGAVSGNAGGVAPGSTDPNANFTY
ncbi:MAG: right-handed parallel beta-helix repeat-containing protein [Phycisphaerales bacterium]